MIHTVSPTRKARASLTPRAIPFGVASRVGLTSSQREPAVRHFLAIFALCCVAIPALAQEKPPPRFEPLTKNDRFRLVRVLGMPELRPSFSPTSAISADGKWAFYAEDLSTEGEKELRLKTRLLHYDVQAGTWPREFEIDGKSVTALDLSGDGGKVVLACQVVGPKRKGKTDTGHELHSCLVLFDLRAGKVLRTIEWDRPAPKNDVFDEPILAVAFSPDESTMLAGSGRRLKGCPLAEGKADVTYDAQDLGLTTALAFLPGGKQFLAGNAAGQVRLFNVGTPKPAREYQQLAKAGFISHLAVSSDGKRFGVAVAEAELRVFEVASGKELGSLAPAKSATEFVAALAFAEGANTVIAVWNKSGRSPESIPASRVLAFDVVAKKIVWSKTTRLVGLVPMTISCGNALLGGGPNQFEVRSLKDGALIRGGGAHVGAVTAIVVQSDGDILSAGADGNLFIWRGGKTVTREARQEGPITALVGSADGKHWLEADAGLTLRTGPKSTILIKNAHAAAIMSLVFSKADAWTASGSGDRTAKTWDLKAGKEIASFAGHSEAVNAVATSPDDKWLATGSDDTTIKLWPIKAGKLDPDREAITLEGHKKPVTCLAFTPDGKALISGSQDQTLKVWDWAKEKAIRTIPGHKNWITSLLLIDAKTALTTSDDLTLRWWDLDSGKELGQLDFGVIGDCPRCLARLGDDRLLVGTSSWLIYELQMQSAKGLDPSK
jgi:WD40 repeat protein